MYVYVYVLYSLHLNDKSAYVMIECECFERNACVLFSF